MAVKVFRIIIIKLWKGKGKKNKRIGSARFLWRRDIFQETEVLLCVISWLKEGSFLQIYMYKYKVSLISYLNSRPFLFGLENSPVKDEIDLKLDIPSKTAFKMAANLIDIGLVPVGSLSELDNYHIIGDYCIGADGPVRTVILASEVPLDRIQTILMDYQSRSSVLLTRVLSQFYWKKEFIWENTTDHYESESISGTTAGIVIGDRVFGVEKKYPYIVDLSSEWKNFTGLPFVFAVWATRKELPSGFLQRFNEAVAFGVKSVPEVEKIEQQKFPEVDISEYFTRNISYRFDSRKKEGMFLFLEYGKKVKL
jgi:chorismate dehydratase